MKRVLMWCTATFLLGIVAAVNSEVAWLYLFVMALLIILVKGLFGKERHTVLLLCMCLTFLAGALEVQMFSIKMETFLKQYQENYVYIYGKVVEEPNAGEDNTKLTVRCETVELDEETHLSDVKVQLTVPSGEKNWNYGDILSAEGIVERPMQEMNDMGFNYERYLRTQGVAATIYCKEEQIHVYQAGSSWMRSLRESILSGVGRFVPGESGALLKGITMGDKSSFTPEMKNSFARAGISHIVAVSGMHMSILMLFVMAVCKRLGLGKRLRAVAASVVILFFMCMIGFTPSVIRAGVTCLVAMLAVLLQRKKDFLTTMALAAGIVAALNPFSIFNVSFLLSFSATIGIVYLAEPIQKLFDFFPRMVAQIIAMSIAANIATFPVTVWFFSDVSLVAVMANVLVVPFVNILFIASFFMAALGSLFPPLGQLLGWMLGILSQMILFLVSKLSQLPYATVAVPRPPMMLVIYYYMAVYAVVLLTQRRRVKEMKLLLCAVTAFSLALCVVQYWKMDVVRLEFINVGQGDSCVVRLPNRHYVLIDTGEEGTGLTNNVVDYLKKRGIRTLDSVFISHADSDHSGGLLEVMNTVKVNKVVVPELNIRSEDMEKLLLAVKEKGVPVETVHAGDSYTVEDMTIKVLWPVPLSGNSNVANDNNLSMVLRVSYKDKTALFMGDLEEEAEEMLVRSGTELQSDVFKVAHHGSKTGTENTLLEAVRPEYSIVSVGKNSYGHPSPDVLARLEYYGSRILRTDVLGNIVFCIDRNGQLIQESR